MENINIKEVIEEIKKTDEETLERIVRKWLDTVRTQSLKIGASYISEAIFDIIKKRIGEKADLTIDDYEYCIYEIIRVISIQFMARNDAKETTDKENENDGTTESDDNANS
jgi:hypothetical protein